MRGKAKEVHVQVLCSCPPYVRRDARDWARPHFRIFPLFLAARLFFFRLNVPSRGGMMREESLTPPPPETSELAVPEGPSSG